jgi:hypothetical protein
MKPRYKGTSLLIVTMLLCPSITIAAQQNQTAAKQATAEVVDSSIEVTTTWDLRPNIDQRAFAELGKKANAMLCLKHRG